MYITGTVSNFENRLHQLAETSGDLTSFQIEGSTYASGVSENVVWKWNKEFKRIYYEINSQWNDTNYITQS